jgi:nucleoside-diphosphate-sugar epimerase
MQCDVAVIGGTGFIGSVLVSLLLEQHRSVRVISRHTRPTDARGPEHVCADVSDAAAIHDAIAGARVIVHLGMGGGPNWADYERDFVRGTENVAKSCVTNGIQRLVYVSSVVAMNLGGRGSVEDDTAVDPAYQNRNHYARGKIAAEIVLQRARVSDGLRFVTFRPGVVVGRGGVLNHGGLGMWVNDTCCLGWGDGRTLVPFVLVQDVAVAIASALDMPGIDGTVFNLAGDVYMTAAEFIHEIAERSLRRIRFYPRSLAILQASQFAEWALRRAVGRPVSWPSFHDLRSRALRRQVKSSRAKRILGWLPNSDHEFFLKEAIDSHLRPVPIGDLRLECR